MARLPAVPDGRTYAKASTGSTKQFATRGGDGSACRRRGQRQIPRELQLLPKTFREIQAMYVEH